MSDKAKMKMDALVWEHGRKKGVLTKIKNDLSKTSIKDNPIIIEAIKVIEKEINRLKNSSPFD